MYDYTYMHIKCVYILYIYIYIGIYKSYSTIYIYTHTIYYILLYYLLYTILLLKVKIFMDWNREKGDLILVCVHYCQLLVHKHEVPFFPHTPAGRLLSISAQTPKTLNMFPPPLPWSQTVKHSILKIVFRPPSSNTARLLKNKPEITESQGIYRTFVFQQQAYAPWFSLFQIQFSQGALLLS